MPITSLKLSEDLKLKAAAAAQDLGVTPHTFMVEAIKQATEAAERRREFLGQANAAREEMLQTGIGYDAHEVHDYLRKRIEQSGTARPAPKPWRK
jgi:hypothetical protein